MSVEKQCVLVEAPLARELHGRGPAPATETGPQESRSLHAGGRRLYAGTTTIQRGAMLRQKGKRLYANPRIWHAEGAATTRKGSTSMTELKAALRLDALARSALDGRGVHVAILDDGIHRESLEARLSAHKLRVPALDESKRIATIPAPFSRGRRTHGTMCAFDVAVVAPKCTLLDFAVNAPQAVVEPRVADAIAVCEYLRGLLERREVEVLIVVAAWQTLEKDEIDGIRTDDPEHPFYQALSALESAGADILFSAPDHHAQFIHGPALHPGVLTVSAIDLAGRLFPTAARGPAATVVKPDIVAYEGFLGYEMFAGTPDYGTSAAAALAAGVIAALRSHARVRALPPAQIREALRATARDIGVAGVDCESGWGVVDVEKLIAWSDAPANVPPRRRAEELGLVPGSPRQAQSASGPEKKRLLLFLLADLLSDDDVRDEFLRDPEGVMDRYELEGEQRCALFSLDPRLIGGVVFEETRATIENEVLSPNWPVPEARIEAVDPQLAQRVVLGELRVIGENLMRGAEVILTPSDFSGPELRFVAHKAEGPIQQTTLSVAGADFSSALPGAYQVSVRNCTDAALIESPFTFTVVDA
jgi:hypothetical protein